LKPRKNLNSPPPKENKKFEVKEIMSEKSRVMIIRKIRKMISQDRSNNGN
jgi:hypothetical protein